MSSAAFWRLVDRLGLPSCEALQLIDYPGKLPRTGKRPRFRLTTRQTRRANVLIEIEAALQALDEPASWLTRRNRTAPFAGRTPLNVMLEPDGFAAVMRSLHNVALRKSMLDARSTHQGVGR